MRAAARVAWLCFCVSAVPGGIAAAIAFAWSLLIGASPFISMIIAASMMVPVLFFCIVVALPAVLLVTALFQPSRHQFLKMGGLLGALCGALLAVMPPFSGSEFSFASLSLPTIANVILVSLALGLPTGLFSAAAILALRLEKDGADNQGEDEPLWNSTNA